MMKRSVKKAASSAIALSLAAAMTVSPVSAVYYSNSLAFDETGMYFAIPEAYRFYSVINRFEGGIGTLDSPADICFDDDGMLYVVDKDNERILIMDGDGKVNTIIGGSMPDGVIEFEEEEEEELTEEPETPEETEEPDEPEEPEEPQIVDMIQDEDVKASLLETAPYVIEISALQELRSIFTDAYMGQLFRGAYTDGKVVDDLTIVFSSDITVSSADIGASFNVPAYRYRYTYNVVAEDSGAVQQRQETVELHVSFEIAEGTTFTADAAVDFGTTDVVNKGTIVVTSKGSLDLTGCTLESSEGEIIQYYMGSIQNNGASASDGSGASIPEGTLATYIISDEYSVRFLYMYLSAPEGICVTDGKIYICDTDNRRLIRLGTDLKGIEYFTEEKVRSEAMLLGSDYNFTPSKVGISNTGMMYVLNKSSYRGFFTMNKNGDFCGFVGATKVTASITEFLVQIFGSAVQKNNLANKAPAPATNLYVVDNMIYTVVRPSSTEPDPKRVMKINIVGSDLFPDGDFTIRDYNPQTQRYDVTNWTDICVDEYGIVTVVDDTLGWIMQLNQFGEIICAFGGKSNRQGEFLLPTALDINPANGRIYVSDSLKGNIQIFEPTRFINIVHEASMLHYDGLYAQAVGMWEEVAAMDETYQFAHVGIAESLYGDGYNIEAMDKFQYAWDFDGYDKAFSDFRLSLFRYYFAPFVLSILALVILLGYGFIAIKRKSDELYK